MKYSLEIKNAIEYYSLANLREIQLLQLELLTIVDKIAKENNINYWLDGGTLLGAERHGGFIPWDDDLDICLLKKDYDKLIPLLHSFSVKNIDYDLMYHGSNIQYWGERFLNKKVLCQFEGLKYNLRIDIFPMKLIINNPNEINNDKYYTDIAGFFMYGKTKYYPEIKSKYHFTSLKDALIKKASYLNFFINKHLNKNSELNIDPSKLLVNYPQNDVNVTRKREYYKYKEIFPLKNILFEGINFPAPNKTEIYLTKLYGNYKSLPPLKDRYPYHSMFTFSKKPNSIDHNYNTIQYINKYFYYSNNKSFKLVLTFNRLKNNGLKKTYFDTILPFIKRGFKFKTNK